MRCALRVDEHRANGDGSACLDPSCVDTHDRCVARPPSGSGVEVLRFARDKTAGTLWLLVTWEAPWNIESIAAGDGFPVLRKPVAPQDLVQALAPLSAVRHGPAHE